ncbi:FAD-dependent oxidoreductase [Saccharopolyspora spinosa]|uniref:FAD-dependent oxidoreductase n=1 Tax=Saccharopolyspora spinosa TaxID=60894 RepID=UPI00376F2ED7
MLDHTTDVVVVGGGLGGVAAALALLRAGRRVVLTEEYDWLGGQLTSQAVPPDEHSWVERFGVTASYRALRDGIRDYYRRHYPLTPRARAWRELNPGAGNVSRLCHEPRVAVAVIDEMLAPFRGSGRLTVLQPYRPVAAHNDGDRIVSVTVAHRDTGEQIELSAPYILDATETGELLPLSSTEYVTGFESTLDTGEPSAPDVAQPANMQAVSVCFVVDHVDGDHTIDKPARYDFWRAYQPDFWGDRMLSFRSPTRARSRSPNVRSPRTRTTTRSASCRTSGSVPVTAICGRSGASPRVATSSRVPTTATSAW